ncbi:MAG: hypothetical protein JW818_14840 [Pirellulales bacterium]|nr:hypothetical protein [Pirellulales bacterium]
MRSFFLKIVTFALLSAWPMAATVQAADSPAKKAKPPAAKKAKPEMAKKAKPETSKKAKSKKAKSKETEKAKPAGPSEESLHTVKRAPLKIDVSLEGRFEARRMEPMAVYPQQWSQFKVLKAVEPGTRVKRGDLLVAVDPEDLDETLADLQTQIRLSGIELEKGRQQLAALEKLTPMNLAIAERDRRIAKEDHERTIKTLLPLSKKLADFMVKMSGDALAYQKEELRQLEKMYKADEITEETEEIVLRRARDALAQAKFSYELAKFRRDQSLKYTLPREKESAGDELQRELLSADQAKILLPLALKRQKLDLERMRISRERQQEKLKALRADRALMTIKSPIDGVVYYGRCVDGDWTGGSSSDQFHRGAPLPTNKVFMTVVQARPMHIVAAVSEDDLQYVHEGVQGVAKPTAFPDRKLTVTVAELAEIPFPNSSFTAKLVPGGKPAERLMPGMTCSIKLQGYLNKKALVIPPAALGTEPLDDDKHFVYRVDKKGKTTKRPVTVGKRTREKVEILKGLAEGDKILRECPKEPPKAPKADAKKDSGGKKVAKKPAKKTSVKKAEKKTDSKGTPKKKADKK